MRNVYVNTAAQHRPLHAPAPAPPRKLAGRLDDARRHRLLRDEIHPASELANDAPLPPAAEAYIIERADGDAGL